MTDTAPTIPPDTEDHTARRVSFLRHAGWISPDDIQEVITIVGCGAVGSHAALLLAKMGVTKFELWDADIVEPHNLSNQAYDVEHLNMLKVEALAAVLRRFNPEIEVVVHDEFFEGEPDLPGGPVVLAVDTMKGRKHLIEYCHDNLDVNHLFEIRLGFDFGIVNVVDNMDDISVDQFMATIKDDSEIKPGPCNLQMCTTLVYATVSTLVHQICRMYVAAKSGEAFTSPYRYYVLMNNDTGATEIVCEHLPTQAEASA